MNHLTSTDLERIRRDTATGEEARHISECDACADALSAQLPLVESAAALRAAFTADAQLTRSPERSPRVVWFAAAAAVAAAVFVTGVFRREEIAPTPAAAPPIVQPSAPIPVTAVVSLPSRPEWDALLAQVRRSGKLPLPANIREFAVGDTFRGDTNDERAGRVWPSATAVEEQKPEFRWPSIAAGARYTVTIANATSSVAESPRLTAARWKSDVALSRGEIYSWQVKVEKGEETFVLPAPPAPPALFRVISADERAELERARNERAGDHLLLGLLYARAGVVDRARDELATSGDLLGRELLKQLPR